MKTSEIYDHAISLFDWVCVFNNLYRVSQFCNHYSPFSLTLEP